MAQNAHTFPASTVYCDPFSGNNYDLSMKTRCIDAETLCCSTSYGGLDLIVSMFRLPLRPSPGRFPAQRAGRPVHGPLASPLPCINKRPESHLAVDAPASGFPVSTVVLNLLLRLRSASVDMPLTVQTDLLILAKLYAPAILDYHGNCSETD